jgi:hypothetical protein
MTSMSAKLILKPITKIYIPWSIYKHTNTFAQRSKTTFARTQSYIHEGPRNVLRISTEITAYIMKYSVKWLEVTLYTPKFPNNISLVKQFYVYVIMNWWHFHDNGSSYEKYFSICLFDLPMKTSFSSMNQLFLISFATLPSHQLCFVTLPHPHCSFNIFIFKFFMVIDYNEVLSIGHTYIEQKANFQTPRLSVSITVDGPIFMICTIIPFTASSSSILRSEARPCSRINHTRITVSLFCPDSISCHVWTKWNSHQVKTLTAHTKVPEKLTPGISLR